MAADDKHSALERPSEWLYELIKHSDWRGCGVLNLVCKDFRQTLGDSPVYWRLLCQKFAKEERLYLPEEILDTIPDHKAFFFKNWAGYQRGRWNVPDHSRGEEEDISEGTETLKMSIQVCARFRPTVTTAGGKGSEEAHVVLPLHQKVQVVMAAKEGRTRMEAMKIIMEERGYALKEDPWADADVKVLDVGKVPKENVENNAHAELEWESGKGKGGAHKAQVLSVNEEGGTVLTVAPGVGLREFAFDTVYGTSTKQSTVYHTAPRHLVMDFINGLNASIIVYGQTGSGKTYTMFGPDASELPSEYHLSREEGIVPRVCTEVLTASKAREALGIKADVSLSFIEVYGDSVKDLLRDQVVGQSRVAGQRYVLDGQTGQPVNNMQEVKSLLATGDALKRKAATAMNDRSSRAHSVVVLTLNQRDVVTNVQHSSQLFLVDLGGSEKISKSKADEGVKAAGTVGWEEYYEGRERLQEATYINQGLFALKKCIDGLNDREQAALDGRPDPYIPYQDSKLTMLLSSALGGNSKTLVVVTASMEARHALETVQALRFGERCGNVANRAQMNSATLQRTLDRIDKEVEECEELIKRFERWETVRVVRKDEFDGEEVVVKSMLVGAEEHRDRMEALLARRRELLGQPEPEAMAEQNLQSLSIPDSALPLAVPAC